MPEHESSKWRQKKNKKIYKLQSEFLSSWRDNAIGESPFQFAFDKSMERFCQSDTGKRKRHTRTQRKRTNPRNRRNWDILLNSAKRRTVILPYISHLFPFAIVLRISFACVWVYFCSFARSHFSRSSLDVLSRQFSAANCVVDDAIETIWSISNDLNHPQSVSPKAH